MDDEDDRGRVAGDEPGSSTSTVPAGESAGTLALVLGAMALVSSWTGWGGVGLGLIAVVCGVLGWRRGARPRSAGQRRAMGGLAFGLIAVVIGVGLEWNTISDVLLPASAQSQTLDECMQQAPTARTQHVCKSQHLEEFMKRYPDASR